MKKLILSLLAFVGLIGASLSASEAPSKKIKRSRKIHQQQPINLDLPRPARNSGIMKRNYPKPLHVVVDAAGGKVIGAYKILGKTKEGYRYGSYYTNLNQIPVYVIENGRETPTHLSVPGATSNIIGYLHNPHYDGKSKGPKLIVLCQYNRTIRPT